MGVCNGLAKAVGCLRWLWVRPVHRKAEPEGPVGTTLGISVEVSRSVAWPAQLATAGGSG